MTVLPDGDYIVNAHYFSQGAPIKVRLRVVGIQPFVVYYEGDVDLAARQEATALVFKVRDGEVTGIRTDVDVRLRLQS